MLGYSICSSNIHYTSIDMESSSQKSIQFRLLRIEGQVRGLMHMVEEERESIDILTQLAALRAALDSVGSMVISDHVDQLATDLNLNVDAAISLKNLVERFLR
jgi:DNA-binding FrmR family transcriptional regulator